MHCRAELPVKPLKPPRRARRPQAAPVAGLIAAAALVFLAGGPLAQDDSATWLPEVPVTEAPADEAPPGDTSAANAPFSIDASVVSPGDSAGAVRTEEDISAKQEELARIRKEIDDGRRNAADLAGQEQDVMTEIGKINEEMSVNHELLSKLAERKAVLLDDLGSAQQDLNRAQVSLGTAGEMLGARLRGIYKFGRSEAMEVLLTSKTFADLAKRIYYLSVVADQDRGLISEFERAVETKRVLVDHIEGRRVRLEQTEAEVAEETDNLVRRREERDALVARLKSKRSYYETMARDLQEASRDLEELLGQLETKRGEGGGAGAGFAARINTLIWPCQGEVISEFGVEQHPKFGTIIRNNGIDIKTTAGTRVRAVGPGAVSFAGPLSGFGNCVIVDQGSGYYTLYGRLESVMVSAGWEVAEGDALGRVGETSAPEGAVLHFEIRQGKKALDPSLWLLK
jgi:septal ring factor EnvC (AmiA/AmiB activator)